MHAEGQQIEGPGGDRRHWMSMACALRAWRDGKTAGGVRNQRSGLLSEVRDITDAQEEMLGSPRVRD